VRQYVGGDLQIDVFSGRDYPDNLKDYRLIIHCGGCMLTRREMLARVQKAKEEKVPITTTASPSPFPRGDPEGLSPFPPPWMPSKGIGKNSENEKGDRRRAN